MSHFVTNNPPPKAGYQDVLGGSFERSYANADDIWSGEAAMKVVAPLLLERLKPDSYVLDVGAGRGHDTLEILRAGHRVDAIDLVAMTEWTHIGEEWSGRVTFMRGELLTACLGRGYDGVLDNGCLHHQHPDAYGPYLRRLRTHASSDAVLVLNLFTPAVRASDGTLWVQHDGRLTRDFTEDEARELLRSAGWVTEKALTVERVSSTHHYLVVAARRMED